MKTPTLIPLALLAAGIVLSSCGKTGQPVGPEVHALSLLAAAPDSQPPHPSPPPHPNPHPDILPVEFVSCDTIPAGGSGTSRWILGNDSPQPFTMHWSLLADSLWAGYPIQGSQQIPRRSKVALNVVVPVPANAVPGPYPLLMTVDTPEGGSYSVTGFFTVSP